MMTGWSVGRRIYFGFGVVLAILASLAAFSFMSTVNQSDTFTEYRGTARQTLLINDLVEDLFQARMAALKYRASRSDEMAEEVSSNIAEITATAPELLELFADEPETLSELQALKDQVEQYGAAFGEMRVLQSAREAEVARLVELGPATRALLTETMEAAFAESNRDAAYRAGLAQQELMLGRFYMERFLLTNSEEAFARSSEELSEALVHAQALMESLDTEGQRNKTSVVIENIGAYMQTSAEIRRIVMTRNEIREARLDVIGPAVQDGMESIVEAVVAHQNVLGPEGTRLALEAERNIVLIALIACGIGAGLALLISRSVAASLRNMANGMHALAEGDLTVEIVGAEQKHELGLMARALEVFKENALKVRALAAEKEAQDIAAIEARQKMMDELQSSFGTVVSAAVRGDFKGRVPTDFPDDELNELASGVNRLLETVNVGVDETGRVLARIAEGDLQDQMKGDFQGEFAALQSSVNETVGKLSGLISDIATTTRQVKGNAVDISGGSSALSERAGQQAASLEETAATMEEMSASIRANADSSASAQSLAADASQRAHSGGEIVQSAINAMSEIEESASKIAEIISVIDGISFQTNLLALNAAVEAARAGDAGKGFAVVASEVRALAQRSSDASADIRKLIEMSEHQVSTGVRFVTDTGSSLEGIVSSIAQVEEAIADIAAASAEQSTGAQEINTVMSQLDGLTQQNSSMAEKSASNARTLQTSAEHLERLISMFTLGKGGKAEQARKSAA